MDCQVTCKCGCGRVPARGMQGGYRPYCKGHKPNLVQRKWRWKESHNDYILSLIDKGLDDIDIAKKVSEKYKWKFTKNAIRIHRGKLFAKLGGDKISGVEMAAIFGVKPRHIHQWVDLGFLPRRIQHNNYKFTYDEVKEFIQNDKTWGLWSPENVTGIWKEYTQVRAQIKFYSLQEIVPIVGWSYQPLLKRIKKGELFAVWGASGPHRVRTWRVPDYALRDYLDRQAAAQLK